MPNVTLEISIHKPWWTHVVFAGAKAVAWLGIPFDIDRFSQWLAGYFKITTRPVRREP